MKTICISILIFLKQVSFGQESKIDSLFKVFQRDIEIEQTYHSGVVIWDNDTKETYYLLMQMTPADSLMKFTDNSNAAIRCIIFGSLLKKNADKTALNQIANTHLSDTAVSKSQSTDVYVELTVCECMQMGLNYFNDNDTANDFEKALTEIRYNPRIILSGLRHGVIAKERMTGVDSLVYNKWLKIVSFTMTIVRKSDSEVLKSENNFFTAAMKKEIEQLNSGDKIVIDDIKAVSKDGNSRRMMPLVITIE